MYGATHQGCCVSGRWRCPGRPAGPERAGNPAAAPLHRGRAAAGLETGSATDMRKEGNF